MTPNRSQKRLFVIEKNEEQTDAEDRQTDVGHSEANNVITASNASPNYQKGDSLREPSLIFIISGGEKKRKRFPKRAYKIARNPLP